MIMKLALLAVLYLSSAVADTCSMYTCVTLGNKCGSTAFCTGHNQFCNYTTYPSGVCANQLANGVSCSSDNSCQSGYCNQGGVCAADNLSNNVKCTYSSDCASQNCVSSVCTGYGVGQSCQNSLQCNQAPNLYCSSSSGTCATALGLNAACTSQSTCIYGLFCSNSTAKCVPNYSFGSGAACNDDYVASQGDNIYSDGDGDVQCGDGLTCVGTKCAAPPSSSSKSCTQDSDCTAANEYCSCNYATGTGQCKSSYIPKVTGASATAAAVSSCYGGSCSGSQTTDCALSKCKTGYCTAQKFLVASFNYGNNNYPSCYASFIQATLPSTCNSASSVAISAFVVFAALAALMM